MQLRTINKAIAAKGIKAELFKGDGYFYLMGDDIAEGQIDAIYVPRVNVMSFERWMEAIQHSVNESKKIRGPD